MGNEGQTELVIKSSSGTTFIACIRIYLMKAIIMEETLRKNWSIYRPLGSRRIHHKWRNGRYGYRAATGLMVKK